MNKIKRKRLSIVFRTKEIFSLIGFLFALIFTIRGMLLIVFTFMNSFTSIAVKQRINGSESSWLIVLKILKNQHIAVLDAILMILCGFIMLHGILGVCYVIKTDFDIRKMFREKILFYLQIISAVAACFIVMAFTRPVGEIATHSVAFWMLIVLAALLGSFHIANGFYNSCITLGIIVSDRSKIATRIIELIIAVFSMLQIGILFI